MNTLVVNLFAGPGAGKSTGACYIFSRLKQMGIDCEYVSEFAKEKVWEHNTEVLKCQFYISGKQAYKISRVNGKVDVIITDSPILLGAMYGEDANEALYPAILGEFHKYNNLNFFIKRTKAYNPNGRVQTEEEAKEIDGRMKAFLDSTNTEYTTVDGDVLGYDTILQFILTALGKQFPSTFETFTAFNQENITDAFLNANGGIFTGEGSGVQYKFQGKDDFKTNFHVTFNGYDGTWTYTDFRNRVYGLRRKGELKVLLELVGLKYEDYFTE